MNDTTAPIGHNEPPDELDEAFENVKTRTNALIDTANRWIKERPVIEDQDTADKASAFIDQLQAQIKAAEEERKKYNKPFDQKIKANNARHKTLAAQLEKARTLMRNLMAPWLERLEREKRQKEEAARREAEAKRKAAEEAAATAAAEAENDPIGAAVAAEQAEKAAAAAERDAKRISNQRVGVRPSVGTGRAKSFRQRQVVHIVNRELIPARIFRMVDDEAVLKVLRNDLELARKTPGVEVRTEKQVV